LLKARTRNWRTWLTVAGASRPSFDCSSSLGLIRLAGQRV